MSNIVQDAIRFTLSEAQGDDETTIEEVFSYIDVAVEEEGFEEMLQIAAPDIDTVQTIQMEVYGSAKE